MSQSESIAALAKGLVAFQEAMPTVPKNSENPFFRSKYADLSDVVETAKTPLGKSGLAVHQSPSYVVVSGVLHHTLKTKVVHESGEWIEEEMVLVPVKEDPQGQGSAITYARRYAYCAALGIVSDVDDDGNAASASGASTSASNGSARSSQRPPPGNARPASDKQVAAIHKIADTIGVEVPLFPDGKDGWTMSEASSVIEQLNALADAKKAPA